MKNKFLPFKDVMTKYTTLFTAFITLAVEYWVNVMTSEDKQKILDMLGDNGPWVTPLVLFGVWLVLRAKKQGV